MQNRYKIKNFVCVMPMAGEGMRFKKYGYSTPKPLIRIDRTPMFLKATKSFPNKFKWIFVVSRKLGMKFNLKKYKMNIKKKKFLLLKKKTEGQASTVYKSLGLLNNKDIIIIHSCDLYFKTNLNSIKKKLNNIDLIVFTSKPSKYHLMHENQFSWLINKKDRFKISLKKNFKNSKKRRVVVGSFLFKNKKILKDLLNYVFKKKMKINNEYYIDSLVQTANNLGYKLGEVTVQNYISWGSHHELLNYNSK